ncbi:MAG: histidine kinase [Muribaculaceae bacterium]|nr:histidine kinase [Muribaculaceae bacterium]
MEKRVIYILCFCALFVITFQLMLTSLATGYETKGNAIMLMTIPGIIIGFCAVLFTTRVLVPRYLLKGRFFLFSILTFLTSYLTLLSFLEAENIGLRWAGQPPRVESWQCVWIYLERACDSVILTILLFALGAYSLYKAWLREAARERSTAELLTSYIESVKDRLDPSEINRRLDKIENTLRLPGETGEETEEEIDSLSGYLRHQLYEMPLPPTVENALEEETPGKFTAFLTARRWRPARHILFQLMLLLMSIEALFSAPDRIATGAQEWGISLVMYLILNILVLVNRFWLRRRYKKRRSGRRYIVETVLIAVIPISLFLLFAIINSPHVLSEIFTPFWIVLFSSLGALCSMILFEGGVTTIFLLQNLIVKKQRADMLAAETARQEFLFLRKQINPHFLFNVLNNINILGYVDKKEAVEMLSELRRLVKYQFEESSKSYISMDKELSLLNSYLGLEASRTDNLTFEIRTRINDEQRMIPTLMLIPIIENAVKHGVRVKGRRWIDIDIEEDRTRLVFRCRNNYNSEYKSDAVGGIGLRNVRRRLELLYGDDKRLIVSSGGDEYSVTLKI